MDQGVKPVAQFGLRSVRKDGQQFKGLRLLEQKTSGRQGTFKKYRTKKRERDVHIFNIHIKLRKEQSKFNRNIYTIHIGQGSGCKPTPKHVQITYTQQPLQRGHGSLPSPQGQGH